MAQEIGKHRKWIDIVGHVFHVLEFDRAGTKIVSGNKVKAKSLFKLYGYLLVESPILTRPPRLPIVHHDDFLLADSVFDEPRWFQAIQNDELLVTYVPEHIQHDGRVAGFSHALHYVIIPKGTLQKYYTFGNKKHQTHPEPEKLFGKLGWHGEIRVQVNRNPKL
ncbi:MAG: hypothetical protein JSV77_02505 [Dehalococcoidales bacterium]|nr:MAG: hypothetical protein JSV77_02505 [Dehalococcoidales bacterium]